MIIESRELWFAATNTYVVAPEAGGLAVVIDAPPDPDSVVGLLEKHDLTPVALLLTHGHIDHMGGAGRLANATGAAAYMHPDDDFLVQDPGAILRALFGIVAAPGEFDLPDYQPLHDKARLDMAGLEIDVVHTPGHTPGGISLKTQEHVLVGDSLFQGSIGRTDFPGGSFETLRDSIQKKLFALGDEVQVYTGHGPQTTIGQERINNPFVGERAVFPG